MQIASIGGLAMKVLACTMVLLLQGATLFATNVALNKPVTASAGLPTFDYVCGAGTSGAQPALGTITDGVFEDRFDCYQDGPYWYEGFTPGLTIDIDLMSTFLLSGAIAQVDNNDTFELQYRDTSGIYHDWWQISGPFTVGFETRPNVLDNTEIQPLPPVVATGLRIFGVPDVGFTDNIWSVAEIQAFTPEPCSFGLLAAALGGLALVRRRKY
jgi:hypothetical protein